MRRDAAVLAGNCIDLASDGDAAVGPAAVAAIKAEMDSEELAFAFRKKEERWQMSVAKHRSQLVGGLAVAYWGGGSRSWS